MASAHELPARRYALPLSARVRGARDDHGVLRGTLIGYQAGSQQAWMTAADLPNRPQWSQAILGFAHQVARSAALAAVDGLTWPECLARRWQTALRQQIPLQLTAALADVATGQVDRMLAETGCSALKLKVDLSVDEAELYRTLLPLHRRHPSVALRLDANQSWDGLSPTELRRRLLACSNTGVTLVEDPVLPKHWPSDSPIALAADLVDSDAASLVALARRGLVKLAVVKPSLCGSLEELHELLCELSELAVPVALSSLFDAPTGLRMLAGVAAAMPGQLAASGLATHLELPAPWRPEVLRPTSGAWKPKNLWSSLKIDEAPPANPLPSFAHLASDWADLLAQAAADTPDRQALVWTATGQSWTYSALDRLVDTASAWLCERLVGPGDRVLLWADNTPDLVVAIAACWRIGAVVAPLHPKLTAVEVEVQQRRIAPALCLYGPDRTRLDLEDGAGLWQPLGAWPAEGLYASQRSYTELAALVATSGTTGQSKLALLTHSALLAAAAAHWQAIPPQSHERWLACLPLCHVSGMSVLLRCMAVRACVVLTPDAQVARLAETLQRWRPTTLSVVPTLLVRLLEKAVPPNDLRVVLVGGASCDPLLLERARRAGWPVRATYGMTETCAQLAVASADEAADQRDGLRRIGPLVPGMRARVVGGATDGELEVSGPQLFLGYLGRPLLQPDQASEPLWFATGDHGHIGVHGEVWVASRRVDRILRGGENVDPLEVEALLLALDGVHEVAVVGVPDNEYGEVVAAWVVVAGDDPDIATRALAQMLPLAPFKRPQLWHFSISALPRNALGKLLREQVRNHWAKETAEQSGV